MTQKEKTVLDKLTPGTHFYNWLLEQECDFSLLDDGGVGWMLKIYSATFPCTAKDARDLPYLIKCVAECTKRMQGRIHNH
jgi:hypothetical protein